MTVMMTASRRRPRQVVRHLHRGKKRKGPQHHPCNKGPQHHPCNKEMKKAKKAKKVILIVFLVLVLGLLWVYGFYFLIYSYYLDIMRAAIEMSEMSSQIFSQSTTPLQDERQQLTESQAQAMLNETISQGFHDLALESKMAVESVMMEVCNLCLWLVGLSVGRRLVGLSVTMLYRFSRKITD